MSGLSGLSGLSGKSGAGGGGGGPSYEADYEYQSLNKFRGLFDLEVDLSGLGGVVTDEFDWTAAIPSAATLATALNTMLGASRAEVVDQTTYFEIKFVGELAEYNIPELTLTPDANYPANDASGTAPNVTSNVGAKAEFWLFTDGYTGTINFGNGDVSGSVDAAAGVISSVSAPSGFTVVSGGVGDSGVKFRAVGNAAQAAFTISPAAGTSYIDFEVLGTDPVVVIGFTGATGWLTIDDDYFVGAAGVIPLTATEAEITDLLNGPAKYDANVESVVKTSTSLTINFFQFYGSGPTAITIGGVTGASVTPTVDTLQDGATVPHAPTFVLDTFTDTGDTAIASHTGELGATWTLKSGFSGVAKISDANRLRSDSASDSFFYTSGTPLSADYESRLEMVVMSSAVTVVGPCVRVSTSDTTGYIFFWNGQTGNLDLYKLVAGSATLLASGSGSITNGVTYVLKLQVVGTSIKCYVNHYLYFNTTDSSIAAAGRAGLWTSGAIGNSTGQHADNFSASDLDRQIVFDGNSLTQGTGATAGFSYPDQCFPILKGFRYGGNFGVSGQTTAQMSSDAVAQIDSLYNSGLYSNILVAWEIRNSRVVGGRTMAEAYSDYVSYCQARQAAGWKVMALTVLPCNGGDEPPGFEAERVAINAQIVSDWPTFADELCDVAADTRLDDYTDATYFNADEVHLTDAGYGVVAELVAVKAAAM